MHLLLYGFTFREPPGFAYGAARARADRSLFSPILRPDAADGLNGSDVATWDVFWELAEKAEF